MNQTPAAKPQKPISRGSFALIIYTAFTMLLISLAAWLVLFFWFIG